ncbi:MAG: nuclear transport factor 2 family protein [Sphingomonadales bacterium]|nr:nuclear transport factor 2 family protein [Sphingomonadales bacterium]
MTDPANVALFERMLGALGTKDFDAFEACLADDILLEWPYPVMDGFPTEQRGARWLRDALEESLRHFTPYAYRIAVIHDMADPGKLIAEYSSHSEYLPTGAPYANTYISLFEFAGGRITRWREYVNPQVVERALGRQATWQAVKDNALG